MDDSVSVNSPRGRGRPRTDPAEQAAFRARLLDDAAAVLAEQGADATTVDDIAAAAGVSRATVYRHLGSLDEIAVAVTFRRLDDWVAGLQRRLGRQESAAAVVHELFRWTAQSVRDDAALSAVVTAGTARRTGSVVDDHPAMAARLDGFRSMLLDALAPHAAELRHGLDHDQLVDHLLATLLDQLSRRPQPAELRRWLDRWLLPAVLEARPPLP